MGVRALVGRGAAKWKTSPLSGCRGRSRCSRELEVVANNIANLEHHRLQGRRLGVPRVPDAGRAPRRLPGQRPAPELSCTTARPGTISASARPKQTGNPLDVSIDGDAFFVVQTPRGERYTAQRRVPDQRHRRAGDRRPATACSATAGRSSSSRPTATSRSTRTARSPCAKAATRVRFAARQAAARALRRGRNPAEGRREPVSAPRTAPQPQAADARTRVVQGTIEQSNVRPVVEMARMIELTRTYTQIANLLQQASDHRRSAIEKLAEVPA